MRQRISLVLALVAMLALGAPLGGCVSEPRCREACEHTCDICDSDCSEGQLKTCIQSCEDAQTAPERAECILDTDLCEDLWQC